MKKYYYKQKCRKCCSLQSVAIVYNYNYGLKGCDKLDEYVLLENYPEWGRLMDRPEGVGIDNVGLFVSDLFDRDVTVHNNLPVVQTFGGRSVVQRGFLQNLKRDIENSHVIIYYNRHYSPVLDYDKNSNDVVIGKNQSHEMVRVNLYAVLPYIDSYISFVKNV